MDTLLSPPTSIHQGLGVLLTYLQVLYLRKGRQFPTSVLQKKLPFIYPNDMPVLMFQNVHVGGSPLSKFILIFKVYKLDL